VLQAVLTAARDASQSPGDRILALETLTSLFNPGWTASPEWLSSAGDDRGISRVIHQPDTTAVVMEPFPSNYRALIAQTLNDLMMNEADSTVQWAAMRLLSSVVSADPALLPIPPGAIRIKARCGDGIVLESMLKIGVPVELSVEGTDHRNTYHLHGTVFRTLYAKPIPVGQPVPVELVPPSGTLVARVAGREVARITDRNGPCAPGERRITRQTPLPKRDSVTTR
jgi:hypothetical protein